MVEDDCVKALAESGDYAESEAFIEGFVRLVLWVQLPEDADENSGDGIENRVVLDVDSRRPLLG